MNPCVIPAAIRPIPWTDAGQTADQQLACAALHLAEQHGTGGEMLFRAVIPSLEEIETHLGRDLLQEARHMVAVHHAHHGAATAALDERVSEMGSVNDVASLAY